MKISTVLSLLHSKESYGNLKEVCAELWQNHSGPSIRASAKKRLWDALDPLEGIYVLVDGWVRSSVAGSKSKLTTAFISAPSLLGNVDGVLGQVALESQECVTACKLIHIENLQGEEHMAKMCFDRVLPTKHRCLLEWAHVHSEVIEHKVAMFVQYFQAYLPDFVKDTSGSDRITESIAHWLDASPKVVRSSVRTLLHSGVLSENELGELIVNRAAYQERGFFEPRCLSYSEFSSTFSSRLGMITA